MIDTVDGTYEYTYDEQGQLLTEERNGERVNTLTYDDYGNITSKNGAGYTYGGVSLKDQLTKYDGQTIGSYDGNGNPRSYLGKNLVWEKGRQLKSFGSNTYTYNKDGVRTSKTVSVVKHSYVLDGTNIVKETWGSNTLIPLYDLDNSVCGIKYNNTAYYFYKNLQGDVIAITDASGTVIARYVYDAWGRVLLVTDAHCNDVSQNSGHIANINPFRYRGYYYDTETQLYYLQSRYYDPKVGRFINADAEMKLNGDILSYELYCYCGNQPISRVDTYGFAWWFVFAVAACIVAVAHVANAAVSIAHTGYNQSKEETGLVSDQSNVTMKFGGTDVAKMGCGAVATHNAIILAGGTSKLSSVVKFMEAHDLTLGFVGVYFTNIQWYLQTKNYPSKIYLTGLKGKIDQKIKACKSKIAILAYLKGIGKDGHYVAIQYKNKQFEKHNINSTLPSVDAWLTSKKYIPLCLITI